MWRPGLFTDPRARQAIYYALDRSRLMKAYTQTDGYKAPASYFGVKSPYYDSRYALPAADPVKAQKLIDELAAAGKPFNVKLVTYPNSDMKRVTSYVQQVLSSFKGVKAEIIEVDSTLTKERCKTTADAFCFDGGIVASNRVEPNISNMFGTGGVMNWGQYSSPAVDKLLAEASSTVDDAKVKAAYSAFQKILVEELPLLIYGEESRFLLVRNNTGGMTPSNGGILQKQYLYVCAEPCIK